MNLGMTNTTLTTLTITTPEGETSTEECFYNMEQFIAEWDPFSAMGMAWFNASEASKPV